MKDISRREFIKSLGLVSLFGPLYSTNVNAKEKAQRVQSEQKLTAANPSKKLIIVDRDIRPQRLYAFQGENSFFETNFEIFSVSTGLAKYGATPLGYYHVRRKQECAVNKKHGWVMPHVQWYSPENCPQGVNGIHEGEQGTKYGIPQSHGCTRMKKNDAAKLYSWSEIDTPIVFIGKENKTSRDEELFDIGDYGLFRDLIERVENRKTHLGNGLDGDSGKINSLDNLEQAIAKACKNYQRVSLKEIVP